MKRRNFSKKLIASGLGLTALGTQYGLAGNLSDIQSSDNEFIEPQKKLPVRNFDVVVAGGGTAGVFAAAAAARTGAKTALVEGKGYTGGIAVEGGTALHSFYNLWKPFQGVKKQQVVKGMPSEFIDILYAMGGCTGHAEMSHRYNYDSVCTAIDTELYKLASMKYLKEAGVQLFLNSFVRGAVVNGQRLEGAIVESRSGRELFKAKSFIDCTGFGDLAAYAGAEYTDPNDYPVVNSFGMGNVNIEKWYDFLIRNDALKDLAHGRRSGKDDCIIRIGPEAANMPDDLMNAIRGLGVNMVTTTVHENYFMYIKVGTKLPKSATNRDVVTDAEILIRENQYRFMEAFRKHVPGMENAFIARTAPSLVVRRGRSIRCDYDLSNEEIINAKHFDDEVFVYGFHDFSPKFQVGKGETYGMPYRALCVSGFDNLYAAGMLVTSEKNAHMSTRNTVSCMAQGQATGTAAALCVKNNSGSRELSFSRLKDQLVKDGVYFN